MQDRKAGHDLHDRSQSSDFPEKLLLCPCRFNGQCQLVSQALHLFSGNGAYSQTYALLQRHQEDLLFSRSSHTAWERVTGMVIKKPEI